MYDLLEVYLPMGGEPAAGAVEVDICLRLPLEPAANLFHDRGVVLPVVEGQQTRAVHPDLWQDKTRNNGQYLWKHGIPNILPWGNIWTWQQVWAMYLGDHLFVLRQHILINTLLLLFILLQQMT